MFFFNVICNFLYMYVHACMYVYNVMYMCIYMYVCMHTYILMIGVFPLKNTVLSTLPSSWTLIRCGTYHVIVNWWPRFILSHSVKRILMLASMYCFAWLLSSTFSTMWNLWCQSCLLTWQHEYVVQMITEVGCRPLETDFS